MRPNVFVIYDMRAVDGNTDGAQVLSTCESLKEAKEDIKEMFGEGVIYECFIDDDNVCRKEELRSIVQNP